MRPICVLLVIIMVLGGMGVIGPLRLIAGDLRVIQATSLETAQRITSSRYSARITTSLGRVSDVALIRSGRKYFVHRDDLAGTTFDGEQLPTMHFVRAYNGQRYQRLNTITNERRLTDGPQPRGVADPLLEPYRWLTSGLCVSSTWENVQDEDLWYRRFEDARYVDSDVRHGRQYDIVEFPQECVHEPCTYRVKFIRENGFPVKYERIVKRTGEVSTAMEVTRFRIFEVDGSSIPIPLEIERTEGGTSDDSLVRRRTVVVREDSVEINPDIDEAIFTLSVDDVDSVYDVQENLRTIEALRVQTSMQSSERRPRASHLVLWMGLLTMFILLAVFVALRRPKGKIVEEGRK